MGDGRGVAQPLRGDPVKVVDIDRGKQPDPCQFCGAEPAHVHLSCPRIKAAELYEDGTVAFVEFFPPTGDETPDE